MIKTTNTDNIFSLVQDIENLGILCNTYEKKSSVTSEKPYNEFNEEEYFRGSSFEYFRNSSLNGNEDNEEGERMKLPSKNFFTSKDFEIKSTLGNGAYAKVIKAKHIKTNELYAIKIIEKRLMDKEEKLYQIYVENEIMSRCNHPNILKLFGCYEDNEKVYLVLEYSNKGNLFEFILLNSNIKNIDI